MNKKDKQKNISMDTNYAQEDWYKSNRTPENNPSYELGQDIDSLLKPNGDITNKPNDEDVKEKKQESDKKS